MNVKSITAYDKRLKSLNQALSRFFVNSYSQIPYGIEKRGIFLIFFILTKRPSFSRTEGIRRARARTKAKNLLQPCPPSETSARAHIRLEIRRFMSPLTEMAQPVVRLPQHDARHQKRYQTSFTDAGTVFSCHLQFYAPADASTNLRPRYLETAFQSPMAQTPFFPKGVHLAAGILVRRRLKTKLRLANGTGMFQSPYGDFGTPA